MPNIEKYQVLCGNEYIKTGQVVIPFNVTTRGAYIDGCDIIVTPKHLRKLGMFDTLWSPLECLTKFYNKLPFRYMNQKLKYRTVDGLDLTAMRFTNQKIKNIIYNDCVINDTSWHGSTLTDVAFVNCRVDIIDLRHATLTNVSFIGCDTCYGFKIDNSAINSLRMIRSKPNKIELTESHGMFKVCSNHYMIHTKSKSVVPD